MILRASRSCLCALAAGLFLWGCDLVPTKPDAVFLVYKDRVRAEKWPEARELLSDESLDLVRLIDREYKPTQPPESLALLNVLDPVTPPTLLKTDDTEAILQLRTLKGGVRTMKLIRKSPSDRWKIDMIEDLKALRVFLAGRKGLDILREQAGEFGESWKAFNETLGRSHFQPPPPLPKPAPPNPPTRKPKGPSTSGEPRKAR